MQRRRQQRHQYATYVCTYCTPILFRANGRHRRRRFAFASCAPRRDAPRRQRELQYILVLYRITIWDINSNMRAEPLEPLVWRSVLSWAVVWRGLASSLLICPNRSLINQQRNPQICIHYSTVVQQWFISYIVYCCTYQLLNLLWPSHIKACSRIYTVFK